MAQVIGSINTINGSFFIKSADGVISAAKVGDTINSGDVIIGSGSNNASNMLTVALNDNSKLISVLGDNQQLFDETMLGLELNSDTVVKNVELNESLLLDTATNNQPDAQQPNPDATLTLQEIEKLDAAAAGGETTPADGTSGVLLARLEDRTGAEVDINTDLRDTSDLGTSTAAQTAEIIEAAPLLDAVFSFLGNVTVLEGTGTATISASLDQTPTTPLVITLSNGATITFGTGYVPGTAVVSTPFPIQGDDVYVDGENYTISVYSTTGGGFASIDSSGTGTVTVNDTTTEGTKVLVSDVTVNEGGTATVEVSVTADTKVALVVTLDAKDADGNNIQVTIPAGTTAGTAVTSPAFVINNAEDVYNDNSSFQVSIVSTDNNPSVDNNFEALDISDKGTVTVNDTTTEGTKVLVSDVTVNEGGTATVEVSVTADTKVALVVTLDAKDADGNNIQVTIPAGTTAGTAVTSPAFVINNAEDVYNDNSSFQVSIVSTDNNPSVDNNFEALDISDKGTVTVNDTTTEGTKVLVSDVTVNEGGTATVEVSVTADTKVALVVTLDAKDADGNNIQVTIPAGTTAGTAVTSPAFVINNAEDVYNDNSSFQVSIVSTDNNPSVDNNFEALDISDKGTVTVNDTTTEGTKVLVSDVTVNEGGTATVEVSVTADTKVALVVTLDAKDADGNNIQVTIPAGTTAGTAVTSPAFVINNAEDVYNDNSSFQVSIVSTDNNPSVDNNFEALDISDKGTVTVNDTTTEGTKVLVSDVTVNEGGTATVEVSVTADTKVALVVTLDAKDADGNNIQVTIPAGTTAGTAVTSPAFVINNAEDVYNDNSSFQVSIVSTDNNPSVDNNFEALDISDKGTVTVNDTTTEGTKVLVSDVTVNEGGTATVEVSVTADTKVALVVTLDAKDADGNNIQVTIPAGTTAGTAVTSPAFVINNAEDVYNDNSSFQVSIVSTDNNPSVDNNFEALDISDKGTVTVNDTTTEGTKVLVSDVTVNEGGTATVEVSVTADTKVALVVTLDAKDADGNNIQVTIPAGTTAGTAVTSPAFVINNAEDVYNDNSSFQVSIVSTDNNPSVDNNFEALDISDKGTVTVNDTTTEGTKVLVSDVTVNEGGTATVEVSVTADTKVALVVTLDAKDADGNNIQVTIPAGTTAGTAVTSPAFVINNAEDVYNDNSSFQVSIVSTDNNPSVDNNFEALDISDKGTVTVNDTTTEGTKVLVSDVTVNEGGTATVEVSVTADTKSSIGSNT
jgi:3-methyladenine DNA glycosylase AlkC